MCVGSAAAAAAGGGPLPNCFVGAMLLRKGTADVMKQQRKT